MFPISRNKQLSAPILKPDSILRVKFRIMKTKIFLIVLSLAFFQSTFAQQTETKTAVKAASSADVASIDAIMKAVYDVISGDAGQKRDWDRFRTLFHKDARMIPSGKNKEGVVNARVLSTEDYIARAAPVMEKDGFFEREIARRVDQYGNIAQVFSSYESFHKKDDKTPFARGINSFQLLNDGTRWWVITIYWQNESPENPIPKQYLKSEKVKK